MSVVPWLWICSSIAARAPQPSAIIAITEATPMITPSMVSAERTLLRRIASRATRKASGRSMTPPSALRLDRRHRLELGRGLAPLAHRLVALHLAVADRDHARRVA